MVDWISAVLVVPDEHRWQDWAHRAGYTLYAKPGGEIEKRVDRWLEIPGSFDGAVRARMGSAGLWLSGNPTKFMTGQNVDGPEAAAPLFRTMAAGVLRHLGLPAELIQGCVRLTRIDVTYSIDLGRVERVREALRVLSLGAKARNQGRSHTSYQTIYFGKHSRRHSLKLYAKGDEIRQHPPIGLPDDVHHSVCDQAAGLLRIELTLRSQQLEQECIHHLDKWEAPERGRRQWQRYWNRVETSGMLELASDQVLSLPRRLRTTYELWAAGRDCAELMSRNTFYKHRRELRTLTAGAVDIALLRPRQETASLDNSHVLDQLHAAPVWQSNGRLSEWIEQTAA